MPNATEHPTNTPRGTVNLPDFLLARIAEDETLFAVDDASGWVTRWLAECGAKRRIVELLAPLLGAWELNEASDDVLALLALPYADHPDFREEWRP